MTCIDLKEAERAAALMEKQAGMLRGICVELDQVSQTLRRNKTLLPAGLSVKRETERLAELSDIMGQMGRALEMTVYYKRQAEMKVTERYEGSRDIVSPHTVLVDCSSWEQLPDDILIC